MQTSCKWSTGSVENKGMSMNSASILPLLFRQFLSLHKKIKLSIKDLVTSTEEIFNEKPHFFVQCMFENEQRHLPFSSFT